MNNINLDITCIVFLLNYLHLINIYRIKKYMHPLSHVMALGPVGAKTIRLSTADANLQDILRGLLLTHDKDQLG